MRPRNRPRPAVALGALALVCLTSQSGCASSGGELRLAEPGEGEPRCVVELHVDYASRPGDHSRNKVLYDGFEVGSGKHTLFPQSGKVSVSTVFWHEDVHTEWRSVLVTRYVSAAESVRDSCASTDAHGHCQSGYSYQHVTKPVSEYERQLVAVTREISDGGCTVDSKFRFAKDRHYRVDYRFIADGQCELTCVGDDGDRCSVLSPREPVATPVRDRKMAHPAFLSGQRVAIRIVPMTWRGAVPSRASSSARTLARSVAPSSRTAIPPAALSQDPAYGAARARATTTAKWASLATTERDAARPTAGRRRMRAHPAQRASRKAEP